MQHDLFSVPHDIASFRHKNRSYQYCKSCGQTDKYNQITLTCPGHALQNVREHLTRGENYIDGAWRKSASNRLTK